MVSINVSKALRSEAYSRLNSRRQGAADGPRSCLENMDAYAPPYSTALCSVGQRDIQGLTYLEEFVFVGEEAAMIDAIDTASESRWVSSSGGRKIANFGGSPSMSRVTETLPPALTALVERMTTCGVLKASQRPNHCLVNSYDGGAACSVHQDGPLYEPWVVTVTLGGPALITFYTCTNEGTAGPPISEVLLKPRGLLKAEGDAYSDYLHGIAQKDADVIGSLCCNCAQANVSRGQVIPRAARRLSLVFVQKRNNT